MKKILVSAASALALLGFPASSMAVCAQVGTIMAIDSDDAAVASPTTFIRYKTGSIADHTFFVETGDKDIVALAGSMLVSQTPVLVTSDAASCPVVVAGSDLDAGMLQALSAE